MKKRLLFISAPILFLMAIAIYVFIACQRNELHSANLPVAVSEAPLVFKSEAEFEEAIKSGAVNLKYYYRPATIPEKAVLSRIMLTDYTLVWEYFVGDDRPENFYSFGWYRQMEGGKEFIDNCITMYNNQAYTFLTSKEVEEQVKVDLQRSSTTANEASTDSISKQGDSIQVIQREVEKYDLAVANLNKRDFYASGMGGFSLKKQPLTVEQEHTPPPYWIAQFTVDGIAFGSCIPYSIEERTLPLLFTPERILLASVPTTKTPDLVTKEPVIKQIDP